MTENKQIRWIFYEDRYAREFAKINYFWLEQFQLLEESDRKYLDNPRRYIIDKGGQIILLLEKEEVVGTCALIHHSTEIVEIAKFAIIPKAQGRGLSKIMIEQAIDHSIEHKYKKMILFSSTKLKTALKLYEKVGFRYKSLPTDVEYDTADIYMELELVNFQWPDDFFPIRS